MSIRLNRCIFLSLCTLLLPWSGVHGEQKTVTQVSEQFSPAIETVVLTVENKQYNALYQEATGVSHGTVILIQGKDQRNFEWKTVKFLRKNLPKEDWSTLAVNVPELSKQGAELSKLLPESLRYARSKGAKYAVIVLFGEGSGVLLTHFTKNRVKRVDALALVSSFSRKSDSYLAVIKDDKFLRFPIFDVIAEFDQGIVKKNFDYRKQILSKNKGYRSLSLSGANHDYLNNQQVLLKRIKGWLKVSVQKP